MIRILTALLALSGGSGAMAAERIYACGVDQIREYAVTGDHARETWLWTSRGRQIAV